MDIDNYLNDSDSSPYNVSTDCYTCRMANCSEEDSDMGDIYEIKYYAYGVVMPMVIAVGVIGNILNLIVLKQPNMKGPAYIYMRGE